MSRRFNNAKERVLVDTGFENEVIWYMYHKYFKPHGLSFQSVYHAYVHCHVFGRHKDSRRNFDRAPSYMSRVILPTIYKMAECVDEIDWEDRKDNYNHCPHFPKFVVGVVDSFPIRVSTTSNPDLKDLLWNKKYGSMIVNILIFHFF